MPRVEVSAQRHEYSCGPTCAHAVINYLLEKAGIPFQKSLASVERELRSWPSGVMLGTIGVWGIKKGCRAAMWISQECVEMWEEDEWPRWTKRMNEFEAFGGTVYREEDESAVSFLKWAFDSGRGPVIAEVDDEVVYGGDGDGHYVVVSGLSKGKVRIQDSYYAPGKTQHISLKKFLAGLESSSESGGGSMLSLRASPTMFMIYSLGSM